MFYLVGIGIAGWKSISLEGVEACKESEHVYIENYTSVIPEEDIKELERITGKNITTLNRDDVEIKAGEVLIKKSRNSGVCLLSGGDPLSATTHIELLRLCKENNVGFKVVHASSIYSSVCETGLHVYKFGKSCSIPYPERNYNPTSFFDIIEENHKSGSHTLVFLDIKKDSEKYMSVNEALKILLDVSVSRKGFFGKNTKVIGISRLGQSGQKIKYGTAEALEAYDFGGKPQILVIPSMSRIEEEYVEELYS